MYIKAGDKVIAVHTQEVGLNTMTLWLEGNLPDDSIDLLLKAEITLCDASGQEIDYKIPGGKELLRVGYTYSTRTEYEMALYRENTRLLQAVDEAKETANAEIESLLQAARDGLLSPPVPGEAWDEEKWYRAGDTVRNEESGLYRCLKTCKNKAPDAEPDYWEPLSDAAPDIIVWADIKSGAAIEAGALVSHNDADWRCIKTHTKSQVRQPSKAQTDYWEVYNGG